MENIYFYCYSYKLMRFLKLQGANYLYRGKHPNGNHFWVFVRDEEFNQHLTEWNTYKTVFSTKQKGD